MLLEPGRVTVPDAPCSGGRSRKAVENMASIVEVRFGVIQGLGLSTDNRSIGVDVIILVITS
jgi:hypothetical protein